MKKPCTVLLLALCAASVAAQSDLPKKPVPSIKRPKDPGMRRRPDPGRKIPADPGAVVVPPTTDPKSVAPPPRNVAPEINDTTPDIDKKSREKSENKKAE